MDSNFSFEVARQTRRNILFYLDGLDEDNINSIPGGFKNNIAWNVGHIFITYQLLVFKNAGLELNVPEDWVEKYRKGSAPSERIDFVEFEAIKERFITELDRAELEYSKGSFENYSAYSTSYGISLNCIEEVFQFIYAHEALHWGVIMAMKKLV